MGGPSVTGFDRLRRPGAAFAVAYGIAMVGGACGLLGATGAATAAGGADRAALTTGVLIAVYQLSGAVASPYVPRLCRNTNPRLVFARVQAASAGWWCVTGVALVLGAPAMPVLLVAAVPAGVANGLMAVLRPILAQCYFEAQSVSTAIADLSVVTGVTWAVGALFGGWLLSVVAVGWGLVVFGVLAFVLAATANRVVPAVAPVASPAAARSWRDTGAALRDNRVVRWSAVLGVGGALFITPIGGLVVPIAQAFRADRPLSGAGILLASFSLGQLCSPAVVRLLTRRRVPLPAGAFATVLCGASLVTLAVVSARFGDAFGELAVWVVIGITFGATRFAAGALYFGAAAESGPDHDAPRNLAAVTAVSLVTAPLGVIVCGAVLDSASAEVAVLASGASVAAMGSLVLRGSRRYDTR